MRTYSARQARTRFGEFLDQVQREPVRVTRRDTVVAVMVSAQDYEALQVFYADRLRGALRESAAAAVRAGMTSAKLKALLADEAGNGK